MVGYPGQTRPQADLGQLEAKKLKPTQNILHNTWYHESTLPDNLVGGVPPPEAPERPHPLADLGQPESEKN